MTAHACPRCRETGFTWYLRDEKSPLTQWSCARCKYSAQEDESKETTCRDCGAASASELRDERGTYYYCFTCGSLWGGRGPLD